MKLLIFGYGGESTLAVSNILLNLSNELIKEDNLEIVLFGYGTKSEQQEVSKQLKIISIKDPFAKCSISKYRFIRKINTIFISAIIFTQKSVRVIIFCHTFNSIY